MRDLRARIFARYLTVDRSEGAKTDISSIVSAMINDANLLGDVIINNVPTFCSSVVGIVVATGIVVF